jgi:RNA polymerase sigma factor for flagellar operon FliA
MVRKPTTQNRDEMILEYTPLIKYVAYRLAMRLPPHISIDDLISAGVIGLMDALTKFDPGKKVEFKTYAEFRIRGAMLDELRSMDWVPRSVRQKATQIERTINQLEKKKGRSVEDEEIALAMGISLDNYYVMMKDLRGLSPFDMEEVQKRFPRLSPEEILDSLVDKEENDPFHQYNLKELKRVLSRAIDELSSKEKMVISLYYYEELTLKEIGEALDLTESRICQIHTKGVIKLRARLKRYLEDAQ